MPSEPARPRRHLSDPRALRALSHPVRLALLELVRLEGQFTATEASERLNESPANCSFHFRTLAKYGFVEEAEGGHGRQRPWRAIDQTLEIEPEEGDAESKMAADALLEMLMEQGLSRFMQFRARFHSHPKDWQQAATASIGTVYLTVEELAELGQAMEQLFEPYRSRRDVAARPQGAEAVSFLYAAFPKDIPGTEE